MKTKKGQLSPQNPSVSGTQFGIYQPDMARFQLRIGKEEGIFSDSQPHHFLEVEGLRSLETE